MIRLDLPKVCSFWSCAFLGLCSSEHTCTRAISSFILPRNSNFWAINSFPQRLILPLMYFTKSRGLLMRWRRMHMTKMNRTWWLSSGNFFRGGKIYCYANFFCYAIVFGPNFRKGQKFSGGQTASDGGAPLPPPRGRKSAILYGAFFRIWSECNMQDFSQQCSFS